MREREKGGRRGKATRRKEGGRGNKSPFGNHKKIVTGASEMVQWLRTLAAISEGPGLMPNTCGSSNHL